MKSKDLQDEVKMSETTEETVETEETVVEETAEETVEEETNEASKKKDKKDEIIAELTDKVTRMYAEFENYRKRTEKEKVAMFDMGAKSFVEKLLPIIDNFERGFSVLSEEQKAEPFAAGMEKIYKQMITNLQEAGLKEIEALNCEFNPDLHNAVMHIEDENAGENMVVEVFQKGYYYKDTVVRHSMVKVAN